MQHSPDTGEGGARPNLLAYATPSRRPNTQVYQDIPVTTLTDWSVDNVKAALEALERGTFYSAALYADYMLRDDRIASTLQTRVLGLTSLPFRIEPSKKGDPKTAQRAADEMKEVFPSIFPESTAADVLRWNIMNGFAIAQNVWTMTEKRWVPTPQSWHPFSAYYRLDTRKYTVSTMDAGPIEIEPGDGKWVLFAPHGQYRGWMFGAMRSLAMTFLLRQYAWRDWARYSEVHGLPARIGKVPMASSDSDKTAFLAQIGNITNEPTLILPVGMDGASFDYELKEAAAGGWEGFERLIMRCDTSITLGILSQNLTSEVSAGSFAAANVHNEVREDLKGADSRCLTNDVVQQILRPWALYNYGDADLAPIPIWDAKTPDDKAAAASERASTATMMMSLSTAITALTASGLSDSIDWEELFRGLKIPMLSTPKPKAPPTPVPPPAAPPAAKPIAAPAAPPAPQETP